MTIAKALADSHRVRVLLALAGGELCVCQIVELLGLAPSTVSKHLSILQHAGLIVSRKTQRWVYCRLPGREEAVIVRHAIDWVRKTLAGGSQAAADRRKLERILKLDPRTICRRQLQR
jgi:ArsR family transcriptional regulator